MNVLMIGGYSYLGMGIGKYLSKKGFRIFVLDTTDDYTKADYRHRFYEFERKEQIENIILLNNYDVIIYLDRPCCRHMKESDYLYVLKEFLAYTSRSKDRRFIFLSYLKSTTFDSMEGRESFYDHDGNLDTVKAMLYQNICEEYRDKYNMKVSILRVSCPYGPECSINILYDLVNRPWKVSLYEDSSILNRYIDYIYVDDVVSAVYKTVLKDENVVLNICSGISYNVSDIRDILMRMDYNRAMNLENYALLRGRAVYSRKRAEECLRWKPETSIVKGLRELHEETNIDSDNEIYIFKLLSGFHGKMVNIFKGKFKLSALGINLSLFLVFFLCSLVSRKYTGNIRLDFRLLYIAIISMAYGFEQGIISASLATLSLVIYPNVFNYSYFDMVGKCLLFFIDTVLISYIRNYQLLKNMKAEDERTRLRRDLFTLGKRYDEVRSENFKLQNGMVIGEEKFSDLYTMIRLLNTLNSDEIINGAVEVVEKSLLTNNVVIFKVNESRTYLRAVAICGNSNDKWKKRKSFRINDCTAMHTVVMEKRTYINKSIVSDIPTIMSPIIDKNRVIYVLGVYDLEFENLDIHSKNRVSMIANIISCYMHSARKYENARKGEIYLKDTGIMNYDFFRNKIRQKDYMRKKEGVPYSILRLDCKEQGVISVYDRARDVVRSNDTFGIDYKKHLFILLENTNEDEAEVVIKRLQTAGIKSYRAKGDHLISLNEEYLGMNSLGEAAISIIHKDGEE